jgi:hypothetical protein
LRNELLAQYEICHNLPTVDLLVSLAYSAAAGGALEDPLPVHLGLRVNRPRTGFGSLGLGVDGLCDFDALDIAGVREFRLLLNRPTHPRAVVGQKRAAIAELIDSLPAVGCVATHANSWYLYSARFRR